MSLSSTRNRLLWRHSDSSSDSDSDELENRIPRNVRNFRIRQDHFEKWNNEEFKMRFRLSKNTVLMLEEIIGDSISPKTNRNHAISAMQQILLVLRFCATGCMLQSVGDFGGIHKSTASQIVKKVINSIVLLAPEYIKMPNANHIEATKRKFYNIAKFPRVLGAIDCTHVKIISPGGNNAEYFRNRKGYFSLNVQVVGDADLRIRDIVARWPGSTHDQTIFNNSRIQTRFETREFGNAILLGDSGYALKAYLITPIPNPVREVEQVFNEAQIRSRNPIERLFGVLKRRFPILSLGIRLSLDTAKSIILACAVLHNIALNMNEGDPIQDPNLNINIEDEHENIFVGNNNHNFRQEFLTYFLNLLEEHNN